MPLTRDFRETVPARAQREPAFREGLLKEGVECLLAGDVDVGEILLRDYIEVTIGFEGLGSPKGSSIGMTRTVTLRLGEEVYEEVRETAAAEERPFGARTR